MFFLASPKIAVVQTGLLMIVGMQSMILAPLILASERMGFRTEPERETRGASWINLVAEKISTVG